MPKVIRFGVSIEEKLLTSFDQLIEKKGHANRSEALRDLIRDALVEEKLDQADAPAMGTVTLVYDHHTRDLDHKLNDLQHDHHHEIISTLHVHLDHHNCMEVILLKGKVGQIQRIASELIGTKGVKHGKLVTTTLAGELL